MANKPIGTAVKATIWATAEPGTGIVAASIAILRPLIRRIRTKASEYGSRKGSYPSSAAPDPESDTIALTDRSQPNKKTSIYSMRSDDPWSPTVVVGRADVQRVISVQMVNGRGSPMPGPTRV